MARLTIGGSPGFEVGVEYNVSNGKATSVFCNNSTGGDVYAIAVLTDGRIYGGRFPQGNLKADLAVGAVTVVQGAEGPEIQGLQRIETRTVA